MSVFEQIRSNQVLVSACLGWLVAQVLKTIIDMWATGSFKVERMYGNGGMPSSHSATVCAMVTSTLFAYGVGSFEFAVTFILALVVMIDAMGVRRETGKQAKVINSMVELFNSLGRGELTPEETLKEFVGHTRRQVVVGAVLGGVIALVMNRIIL